jgi:energy-coupling factor transporter transmembrane protein EcfT
MLVCSSPAFENFVRLQPLRTFHLITIVFVVLLGGVFGEYAGKKRPWAIAALAGMLAAGMFFVGRATYPDSPQLELPSAASPNAWVNTLLWIRHNTPEGAVFAVDSHYMRENGVDAHGFRAVSERSAMADAVKDSGAASLFPSLAPEWKQMSEATTGLNRFTLTDFERLKRGYPQVDWTVIHGIAPAGLDCPYRQQGYSVCRIP